jgi:hypothetical protein
MPDSLSVQLRTRGFRRDGMGPSENQTQSQRNPVLLAYHHTYRLFDGSDFATAIRSDTCNAFATCVAFLTPF